MKRLMKFWAIGALVFGAILGLLFLVGELSFGKFIVAGVAFLIIAFVIGYEIMDSIDHPHDI